MTVILDNGVVIDERFTAAKWTRADQVPEVFECGPRVVSGATVHHWGSYGQTHDGVVNFFCTTAQTSAHFVVSDGRVTCIVNPDDAAWHAGNPLGNTITIGIECRPECTPGDVETLASLIRYLQTVYGDLTIYTHQQWTQTACPGAYAGPDGNIRSDILDAINATVQPPAPAPEPPIQEDPMANVPTPDEIWDARVQSYDGGTPKVRDIVTAQRKEIRALSTALLGSDQQNVTNPQLNPAVIDAIASAVAAKLAAK